jgi:cell fate regulator YaaT (PSP1 superfamily)
MPNIVGVRFKSCGKIYDFDVNGINSQLGVWVVIESEMGLGLGLVVKAKHFVEQPEQQFKKIIRIATVEDIEMDKNNRSLEDKAKAFCMEKIKSRNLPMKAVGTEATLDKKRLTFYFTAEGRIDFRELVRDLASKFKTRIEMRQIGVRDEVKFIGGIGACGREVCCKAFLSSFEPVSIRMAKKQELVLNPGKLSGICGRLMCCLGYEIAQPSKKEIAPEESETVLLTDEYIAESDLPTEILKSAGEKPLPESSAEPEKNKPGNTQVKTAESPEKDRRRPFNKRKKFWKKRNIKK